MNENPGGTPNPLNPNQSTPPTAAGSMPSGTATNGLAQEAANQPMPEPMVAEAAVALETMEAVADHGVAKEQPVAPIPNEPTPEGMAQPIEPDLMKQTPGAKPKAKKVWLIVAIILLLVAVVAGTAVALIVLKPFAKTDAVPAALAKLLSNDAPKVVSMNGKINLSVDADALYSPLSNLTIDFTAGVDSSTTQSYTSAKLTATLTDESEFSFDVDEVHVADGGLYLKLSNIAKAIAERDSSTLDSLTNCIDDESGMTNCYSDYQADLILSYLDVFEVIDGEWIFIPDSTFSNLTDVATIDAPTQCLIDAAGNLDEYGNDFVKMYQANPFINYSTDNLKIAKAKDTLYRLSFDANNLTNFINSMSNSGFANELLACMGEQAVTYNITNEMVQEVINYLPVIYVEINDNDDFTRVYLAVSSEDGSVSVTADISLAYPSSISIEEPGTYIELNDAISQILTMLYGDNIYDSTTDDVYSFTMDDIYEYTFDE